MKITPKSIPGLRIFEDEKTTRFCLPVAPGHLVYKGVSDPSPRPLGEVMEIAEEIFEGKFGMPLQTDPQKALDSAQTRTESNSSAQKLATLEIWSLEPDSFDLVLKIPNNLPQTTRNVLLEKFLDRAHQTARTVDNLDLLRYEHGPSMPLPQARQRLSELEQATGTQLDSETLLLALKSLPQ